MCIHRVLTTNCSDKRRKKQEKPLTLFLPFHSLKGQNVLVVFFCVTADESWEAPFELTRQPPHHRQPCPAGQRSVTQRAAVLQRPQPHQLLRYVPRLSSPSPHRFHYKWHKSPALLSAECTAFAGLSVFRLLSQIFFVL